MAKFVILNFDETDRFRLTTERPELSLAFSTFNPAKPGTFFLPEDSEAIFIQLIGLNPVKDLGHDAASALARFAEAGGRVVCFIGPSDQAELGKLIGPFPELRFQPNSLPESIFFNPDEPFQSVFEQFQMSISHAYKLLPAGMAGDAWEGSPKLGRPASVLAKSSDGCPVALLLPRGRGSYVLLPWFGTNNMDVVSSLISAFEKKAAPAPRPDLEPVIPDVPGPAPEPEILPPTKSEPEREEAPEIAAAPPLADVEPAVPDIPGPVAEPETLLPTEPEPAPDVAAMKELAALEVEEPLPAPVPAPSVEPKPAQAPDKIPVPSIPDLVAGGDEIAWLEQEEYAFPELREIYAKREEETRRHAQAMQEIEQRLQAFKDSGQEAFLNLLRSEGRELVQAVIYVLNYLGWDRVIDVHDYWKKVIRAKEEDIWVMESEGQSVEVGLMRDNLLVVLVRSGKAWATDDECALLQRYKGRRIQEYNNTRMKALLIGNYFMTTEGKLRTSPFSPLQVEEAQKDGNALLSTYDLFQAIKAEKEGRVTKEELRRQILEKSGLIQFEF